MAGVKALITLALTASIGLLFLILACALPQFNNWAPFWVIVFYILLPIPSLLARRNKHESSAEDLADFFTAGIVVCAFALPIVMSRAPVTVTQPPDTIISADDQQNTTSSSTIAPEKIATDHLISGGACFLTLLSNTVIFCTIFQFFKIFDDDDDF